MTSNVTPDQADVDALRELLDLMENFSDNDQRARYLLTCDWMRTRVAEVERERDEARAKLDLPCGSCHPCTQWAAETWKREWESGNRRLPHVSEWDSLNDRAERAEAKVRAVEELLHERQQVHGWFDAAYPAENLGPAQVLVSAVRAALDGEGGDRGE